MFASEILIWNQTGKMCLQHPTAPPLAKCEKPKARPLARNVLAASDSAAPSAM